jgi:hypothetical protein
MLKVLSSTLRVLGLFLSIVPACFGQKSQTTIDGAALPSSAVQKTEDPETTVKASPLSVPLPQTTQANFLSLPRPILALVRRNGGNFLTWTPQQTWDLLVALLGNCTHKEGSPELAVLLSLIQNYPRLSDLINMHDEGGRTLLELAVIHNFPEIVALLLRNGADPNGRDQCGNTPLMLAIMEAIKTKHAETVSDRYLGTIVLLLTYMTPEAILGYNRKSENAFLLVAVSKMTTGQSTPHISNLYGIITRKTQEAIGQLKQREIAAQQNNKKFHPNNNP